MPNMGKARTFLLGNLVWEKFIKLSSSDTFLERNTNSLSTLVGFFMFEILCVSLGAGLLTLLLRRPVARTRVAIEISFRINSAE